MAKCALRNSYGDKTLIDPLIQSIKDDLSYKTRSRFREVNTGLFGLEKYLTPNNVKSALAEADINITRIEDLNSLSFSQYRQFMNNIKALAKTAIEERDVNYEKALDKLNGKVEVADKVETDTVKKSTKKLYLFGDNTHDRTVTNIGNDLRSLSNAFGIDLRKSKDEEFTDNDLEEFKERVDEVFTDLIIASMDKNMKIVIPKTFLAQMAKLRDTAPELFDYLQEKIDILMNNMKIDKASLDSLQQEAINISPIKKENTVLSTFSKMANSFTFQRGIKKRYIKHYQMYSGGAKGSDKIWGDIAVEYGVDSKHIHHYYGEGYKTPYGNEALTEEQLSEANEALDEAAKKLGRDITDIKNKHGYNYATMRRNYYQVKNASSVLAVSSFVKDEKGKITNEVSGGTAYAIEFAKEKGIPIYLFDQEQNKWFEYAGQDTWEEYDGIPEPTSNFAGIGTREINKNGENAIRGVFEQHVNQNTGEIAGIDLSGHTIYSVEHGLQLAKFKHALDKGAITKAEFNEAVKLLDEAAKEENPLTASSKLREVDSKVKIKDYQVTMQEWTSPGAGRKYSLSEQVMYQLNEMRLNTDPEFRKALEDTKLAPLTQTEEMSEWSTKYPNILDRLRRKHFYNNSKVGIKDNAAAAKENKNRIEAMQSLNKKRSNKIGAPMEVKTDKASMLLAQIFPDLRERMEHINFVHNLFVNTVERVAIEIREDLKEAIDNGTASKEDIELYDKLNVSDSAELRFAYLQEAAKDKHKLQSVFADMQRNINDIYNLNDPEGIDLIMQILDNPNDFGVTEQRMVAAVFGDLKDYAAQVHPQSVTKQKEFMVRHIKDMIGDSGIGTQGRLFKLTSEGSPNNAVFNALLQAARFSIALTEGILFDAQTGDFFNTKTDENLDDETEAMESQDKEHYMIKYQMLDPQSTLTKRMKYVLANLPMMQYKNGRAQTVFNSFGMKMHMTPEIAFMNIMKSFSKVNNIREFDKMVGDFFVKHPWFKPIADKITQDKDFRNEFYRTFVSKGFTEFVIQDATGNVIIMNRGMENAEILQQMENSYLSGMTLTEDSIYNHMGAINRQKVDKWITALTKNKNNIPGAISTASVGIHDLFKTKVVVGTDGKTLTQETNKKPLVQIRNIIEAISLLNTGKHPKLENDSFNYSFANLLNAIGIDTEAINMDALLPTIESLNEVLEYTKEKYKKGQYIVEQDKNGNHLSEEEGIALAQIYEIQNAFADMKNIVDILDKTKAVLKAYRDNDNGNYFKNNKNFILSIFNKLPLDHTKFESDKFYHGKTERHSYIAKSYLQIIANNLKTEDMEAYQEYLHEKYGQYDFSKRPDGSYANSFLREITQFENGELTSRANAIRNRFKIVQQLSMGGTNKKDAFSSISRKGKMKLHKYTMYAFYNTMMSSERGNVIQMARYRGPLLSDSGNHMLFEMPRYDDEREIISYLVDVAIQEADRIHHYRNNSKVEVEGLSKAGKQFVFFPMLNHMGMEYLKSVVDGSVMEHAPEVGSIADIAENILSDETMTTVQRYELLAQLFNDVLTDVMESEFKQFVERNNMMFNAREKGAFVAQVMKFQRKASSIEQGTYHDINNTEIDIIEDMDMDENITDEDIEQEAVASNMKFTAEQQAELDEIEDKNLRKSKENEFKLNNEFESMLRTYFFNDFLAQINITELLIGDPALYGTNPRNIIKRLKEMNAAGDMIWYLDENNQEINEYAFYVEDLFETSPTWDKTVKLFVEQSKGTAADKAMIRGALNSFKNICATDGQTLRTLPSFKKIFQLMGGMWNERTERLFQKLQDDKQEITADDIRALAEIIKPFLRSKETVDDNGRITEIGTQHKNSEYMVDWVFSMMFSRVHKNNAKMRGLLRALKEGRVDDGTKEGKAIDAIHFHSVVKIGYFNGINVNYSADKLQDFLDNETEIIKKEDGKRYATFERDGVTIEFEVKKNSDKTFENYLKAINDARANQMASEANLQSEKGISKETFEKLYKQLDMDENEVYDHVMSKIKAVGPSGTSYVHKVPVKDYRIIQPSSDHMMDHDGLIGTQLVNVISADFSDQVSIDFGTNKGLSKENALEVFNEILVAMDRVNFASMEEAFKDDASLQAMLFGKMQKDKQYDMAMYEALELDDDGHFVNPLNHQLIANKIEPLILSGFKNSIQRKKILGGNVVLTSSYGLRDDLHVKYKEGSKTNSIENVEYIPAYITAPSKDFLQDYLTFDEENKCYDIDIEAMKREMGEEKANDMLDMIGYRIPTEAKFSMVPIRIVGFLPQTNGSAIILPSDVVAMSGTDFDEMSTLK